MTHIQNSPNFTGANDLLLEDIPTGKSIRGITREMYIRKQLDKWEAIEEIYRSIRHKDLGISSDEKWIFIGDRSKGERYAIKNYYYYLDLSDLDPLLIGYMKNKFELGIRSSLHISDKGRAIKRRIFKEFRLF